MKLYYSQNSPFARIARIALRESGMLSSASEELAANRQPDNPVLKHSLVGRVPTLVDGDVVITEAKYVFSYLAEKSGSAAMLAETKLDWKEIGQEGQILGFVDGVACWVRENRRNSASRSKFLVDVEIARPKRCFNYLEREANAYRLPDFPAFRGIVLAAGLGLMDLHKFYPDWRSKYQTLSAWFEIQEMRSSMRETTPE